MLRSQLKPFSICWAGVCLWKRVNEFPCLTPLKPWVSLLISLPLKMVWWWYATSPLGFCKFARNLIESYILVAYQFRRLHRCEVSFSLQRPTHLAVCWHRICRCSTSVPRDNWATVLFQRRWGMNFSGYVISWLKIYPANCWVVWLTISCVYLQMLHSKVRILMLVWAW